ncbi:hypothetical protein AAHA92_28903 [Salvia divinorum]|uniref:FAF domain-containing protein n=1 Tax=Salvia divinorum TaxID=28513 RepID=A0ABD1FWJ8_SALDI
MPDPEFGDCVGVESAAAPAPQGVALSRRKYRQMVAAQKKEFPPPISRLEWEMKKYCTSDGRLIIRKERVRRHEYFIADRSDGRLVLNLVYLDEDDFEESGGGAAEEASRPPEICGGDEAVKRDLTVEEVAAECYKYNNSMGLKQCGGFVPTVAVFSPPVRTGRQTFNFSIPLTSLHFPLYLIFFNYYV